MPSDIDAQDNGLDARQLIDRLIAIDTLKTWSLIVTLLGDMGSNSSAAISGKELGTILSHIGIKPEAVRVALHRLKKERWIVAIKAGREVSYQLSEVGLTQTFAAYEDVYRETNKFPRGWQLTHFCDDYEAERNVEQIAICLSKSLWLIPASAGKGPSKGMVLDFDRATAPRWFEERIVPAKTLRQASILNSLAQELQSWSDQLNNNDRMAIRLLFLHHWRKMALRNATWAHIGLFELGPLAAYHRHIIGILKSLPNLKSEPF